MAAGDEAKKKEAFTRSTAKANQQPATIQILHRNTEILFKSGPKGDEEKLRVFYKKHH